MFYLRLRGLSRASVYSTCTLLRIKLLNEKLLLADVPWWFSAFLEPNCSIKPVYFIQNKLTPLVWLAFWAARLQYSGEKNVSVARLREWEWWYRMVNHLHDGDEEQRPSYLSWERWIEYKTQLRLIFWKITFFPGSMILKIRSERKDRCRNVNHCVYKSWMCEGLY